MVAWLCALLRSSLMLLLPSSLPLITSAGGPRTQQPPAGAAVRHRSERLPASASRCCWRLRRMHAAGCSSAAEAWLVRIRGAVGLVTHGTNGTAAD